MPDPISLGQLLSDLNNLAQLLVIRGERSLEDVKVFYEKAPIKSVTIVGGGKGDGSINVVLKS